MCIERAVSSLVAIAIVASIASILGAAAYTLLHTGYQVNTQIYRGLPALVRCWNFTSVWLCSIRVFESVYGNISIATTGGVASCGYRYMEAGYPSICIVSSSSRPVAALISVDGAVHSYPIDAGDAQ
ncbi:MAG: hypothetical protein N3D82_03285 [Ignisphaera sp.]|nr:hypothetical protein [Ignisphaera sp.]MCX8168033.1 hypothetical protein [Ignisphaera sp.]MDW8086267.1 hypothetical protein [Ignisphaera sp.]